MEYSPGLIQDEVVDQATVAAERLSSNPRRAESEVCSGDLREEALEVAHECSFRDVAPQL